MIVKVCGLTRQEDLDAAGELGSNMCGFIFHRASPRCVSPEQAALLHSGHMLRVGVFVDSTEEEISRTAKVARLDLIQLHGSQDEAMGRRLGSGRIIRVLWPQRYSSLHQLRARMELLAASCSWFLLDAGKSGGGSGESMNWTLLKGLRAPRPWLLAGGLGPDNICKALAACTPDGLDLNSGVEKAPGRKCALRMRSALGHLWEDGKFRAFSQ